MTNQPSAGASANAQSDEKARALRAYVAKVKEHREWAARVKKLREETKLQSKKYEKTEDDLKALQGVGQLIGEVLRQLDSEKFIVKTSSGPRYVVGSKPKLDKSLLTAGTRVALDMTTLTVMRRLQREVDPLVFNMLHEDPGNVHYSEV
ncbi:26S proteasome regulatory ATPase subunit, putative, partial [Eimeria maxima]